MSVTRIGAALCAGVLAILSAHAVDAQGMSAGLEIASRCLITGGTDNKNNCPEIIIKKYYIEQQPTLGMLRPGHDPQTACPPNALAINAGQNLFEGSVFPYEVIAFEHHPLLVVGRDDDGIVIKLLVLLDENGVAIASIRDNKFRVRAGFHVDYDLHSLSIYQTDESPLFKLDLVNRCYATLLGEFKLNGGESLSVLPDNIVTEPKPSAFGHNFFGDMSICVENGRGAPCAIPPASALADDWR